MSTTDLEISDSQCPVSWRARPGSFVGLMTLYESNYIRLGWLIDDLSSIDGAHTSNVEGDCRLHLRVEDRSRYTTTFSLTYLFEDQSGAVADPDLHIRVYHDARLAEVRQCARWHRHDVLESIRLQYINELEERWLRNVMLNKWIEYCYERGHHFSQSNR